jgi:hypothetical protein
MVRLPCAACLVLAACAPRPVDDGYAKLEALALRQSGASALTWPVHSTFRGRPVVCAYPSARDSLGRETSVSPPLIAFDGKVIQENADNVRRLDRLQSQMCGPDWVKPLRVRGIS